MTLEKVCAFSVVLALFPLVSKWFHSTLEKLTCQKKEGKKGEWNLTKKIIKVTHGSSAQPKLYLFS